MKIKPAVSGLYGVLTISADDDIAIQLEKAEAALIGGCRILQLRHKTSDQHAALDAAMKARDLCSQYESIFIYNDHPGIANKAKADGVHIGQSDTPIKECRDILGQDSIIGVSCHNSIDMAQSALDQGADYIALGRFFPSRTKPDAPQAEIDTLQATRDRFDCAIVAIGGINKDNAPALIEGGADAIAVVDSLFGTADVGRVQKAARELSALFT